MPDSEVDNKSCDATVTYHPGKHTEVMAICGLLEHVGDHSAVTNYPAGNQTVFVTVRWHPNGTKH